MNRQTALQRDSTGVTTEKNRRDESATYFCHLDALETEALLILRSYYPAAKIPP